MGIHFGCKSRRWFVAQKPDRPGLPAGRGHSLPSDHSAAFFCRHMEAFLSLVLRGHHAAHCRALAHPGHTSKSAHFCFYPAQRRRPLSRLSVVLLHQRTAAAFSQPTLSTRLRHRPAPLLLAISPDLAFSLECLLPRCREVVVSSNRPCRAHPDAGPLLDR